MKIIDDNRKANSLLNNKLRLKICITQPTMPGWSKWLQSGYIA